MNINWLQRPYNLYDIGFGIDGCFCSPLHTIYTRSVACIVSRARMLPLLCIRYWIIWMFEFFCFSTKYLNAMPLFFLFRCRTLYASIVIIMCKHYTRTMINDFIFKVFVDWFPRSLFGMPLLGSVCRSHSGHVCVRAYVCKREQKKEWEY